MFIQCWYWEALHSLPTRLPKPYPMLTKIPGPGILSNTGAGGGGRLRFPPTPILHWMSTLPRIKMTPKLIRTNSHVCKRRCAGQSQDGRRGAEQQQPCQARAACESSPLSMQHLQVLFKQQGRPDSNPDTQNRQKAKAAARRPQKQIKNTTQRIEGAPSKKKLEGPNSLWGGWPFLLSHPGKRQNT